MALTVGADCAEAFLLMYALELSCRVQMLASGQPYSPPPDDLGEHTAQQLNDFPVQPREREWPALLAMP